MTKDELLAKLAKIQADDNVHNDTEVTHINADEALLEFINDAEIEAAFREIPRWYA